MDKGSILTFKLSFRNKWNCKITRSY